MKVRNAALAVTAALLLAACGGSEEGGPQSRTSGEPQAGGTIVVARTGDITGLDPHVATAFQTVQALDLVHGTLVRLDPELEVVPGLATSWEFSEDGQTLTFTLREGVTYHDGDPFTSADVVATMKRIQDEATAAVGATNFASVVTVEAPDDMTVVMTLSKPDAAVLTAFADTNSSILSDEDLEAGTAATKPNGTGPFRFGTWNQGRSVELTANESFWDGVPLLDGVDIRVIPDEASVLNALRAGEAQMGILTDPTVVQQVSGSDIEVLRAPTLAYHALMLNATRGPLGDEKVRQAIACAIDRQDVIDSAALGEGEDVGPITIPAYDQYDLSGRPCQERDVDKARALLQEAGHAKGFTLNSIVMTGGYSTAVAEAQTVQSQLADIGVELKLETLESAAYVDRWLAADFDAAIALNGGRVDPHTMYSRYFTSDGNLNKVAAYSSPELDALIAEGVAATDSAERERIYAEFAEELENAAPWVWLFRGYDYRAITEDVQGFVPMPTGSLQYLAETSLS
jgi:peptide/nickel transport system substrate-binding protein